MNMDGTDHMTCSGARRTRVLMMSSSRWMLIGALTLASGTALASDARSQLGYADPHTRRGASATDPTRGYVDPHTPRYSQPDQNANATLGYDDPHARRNGMDKSTPSLAGQVEHAPWTASLERQTGQDR